jgi:hypothetical protein
LMLTPAVSTPASMMMSIIANSPERPGEPSDSGANAVGGTGGEGSIPDKWRTRRKMTSPDTKDCGRDEALGYGGGRFELTHCTSGE